MPDPATSWGAGEYPLMAQRLRSAAKRVVERARVAPGERVLDVACGTGNAALLAFDRGGGDVVGVDLEPALLEVARARAMEQGRASAPRWVVGDAAALPGAALDGGPFDAVLSVFGAMYAADAGAAARELARAVKPAEDGGRVVLASWSPGSFMPAMGAALAPFLPAPPASGPAGAPAPSAWGDPDGVAPLLGAAGLTVVSAEPESLTLALPDRMNAVAFLIRTAGNVLAERPRLEREGRWGALLATLGGLIAERDTGLDGRVALRCDYLLVEARAAAT